MVNPSSISSYGGSHHSRYSHSASNLNRYSATSRVSAINSSISDNNLQRLLGQKKKSKPPWNEFGIPYGQPGAGLTKPGLTKRWDFYFND